MSQHIAMRFRNSLPDASSWPRTRRPPTTASPETRFGALALAIEVAVLLAFTFGGGLQALHDSGAADSTA
jgi:hypothetical protein